MGLLGCFALPSPNNLNSGIHHQNDFMMQFQPHERCLDSSLEPKTVLDQLYLRVDVLRRRL